MKAVEFVTTIKQTKTIEIPKKYASEIFGNVRVILLLEAPSTLKTPKKKDN